MALLQQILYGVNIRSVAGHTGIEVNGLQLDSRKVEPGNCFIAVKGTAFDGHEYIDAAIANGATSIVAEHLPPSINEEIQYIIVADSAAAAGILAHNFYGQVSLKLVLVGVTGTNGKTTIATLLYKLFTGLGNTCGLISTVENRIGNQVVAATHTTPDAISLNKLLAEMYAAGCTHVFMEVSSHALHQKRVQGIQFTGGIFTNITHDHLDYHKTFDEYIRTKKSFFDGLSPAAFAISNADDKRGGVMVQNTRARTFFYALKSYADFKGKVIENTFLGLQLLINDLEVHCRLVGIFNAYNLLAVYAAAVCLGEEKQKVLQVLSNLEGAEGRFEYTVSPREKIVGIVDYAHTPDALLNVLATIKNLRQGEEKIICVVGCGGDRDKTKRPVMAAVACEYSDKVILTSDNPRTEEPTAIIRDMEAGVPVTARKNSLSITDRREAIKTAVMLAQPHDIVLIAGKGHEKYQEVNGVKHEFDDKKEMMQMMASLEK